jgi:hypothetical protein
MGYQCTPSNKDRVAIKRRLLKEDPVLGPARFANLVEMWRQVDGSPCVTCHQQIGGRAYYVCPHQDGYEHAACAMERAETTRRAAEDDDRVRPCRADMGRTGIDRMGTRFLVMVTGLLKGTEAEDDPNYVVVLRSTRSTKRVGDVLHVSELLGPIRWDPVQVSATADEKEGRDA